MRDPAREKEAREAFIAENFAVSLAIWKELAELGNPDAQVQLGLMYESGVGVGPSLEKAVAQYEAAANQGYVDAYIHLGDLAERSKNFESARRWYEKGALKLDPLASWRLAYLLRFGTDVIDSKTAMHWLKIAAEQGHVHARFLRVRQVWNGRLDGGLLGAASLFFQELGKVIHEATSGTLKAGDRRLKK